MAGPKPNSIGTSELKSRIMNLAQTSVYQVKIQPPSAVDKAMGGVYQKYGRDIDLLCSDTTLPGSSLATHDVTSDYMGVSEKMAYRRIYDNNIDMTFYVDKNYNVIEFFDGWMDFISGMGQGGRSYNGYNNVSAGYRMSYPKSYKTKIYVSKFEKDAAGKALYYNFIDAFPIAVNATPVSYSASDILKLSVSFSYVRYTLAKASGIKNPYDPNNSTPIPFGVGVNNPLNTFDSSGFDLNQDFWRDPIAYSADFNSGIDLGLDLPRISTFLQ
tara:strand:- start:2230 stop:3042 length:813 start_codon:yes stop_codon:yes gene_type:complete